MRTALEEARKGLGRTSPNPAVGAILVANDRILSRGHHRRAGEAHAEIICLAAWGQTVPRNATLYVTLEPCSTIGRTGPCTEAIMAANVRRLVVGALDPNPKHNGRGLAILRRRGIEVKEGVLGEECAALNEGFNKWITTGRPLVVAKCGMTLDGRLTLPRREGRWITSAAARRDAQKLRQSVDAIMVGAGTVRIDDPRLTLRPQRGRTQPWRVVLTKSGRVPGKSHILNDRFRQRTLIYQKKSLTAVLQDLGKRGVLSVLIEGGGEILGQALDARVIDKFHIYVAPVVSGGPVVAFAGKGAGKTAYAVRLAQVQFGKVGPDIVVTGYAAGQSTE